MTAIVYRDGVMAADTMAWCGSNSTIKVPSQPKIIRLKDGGLIGCAGAVHETEPFKRVMLECGNIDAIRAFERDYAFVALWAQPNGTILEANWDRRWIERLGPFFARGAPEDFLWGCLHADASAQQAVQLAIDHTDGAAGSVQVERLDGWR